MSIKKWFVFISLAAVLALSACSAAPTATAADNKPAVRQLNTVGQGKVYLVPDLAYIYIGVHSEAATVADALKVNNTQAQAIQKSLTDLGVDVKDIQTSAFNVYPQQQQSNPKNPNDSEMKTIYVVENTVNVTVRDLTKLGSLLDKVTSSGANSIHGITFDVKDKAKALAEARQQAIDDAKSQAAELAKAAGVQLGAIQTLNVYTGGQPGPVYQGKGGFAAAADSQVPVSSGQLLITAEANISFEIK